MVTGISGRGGAMRSNGSDGAHAQIEGLMAQITSLRKRIATLYKKMMETSDPALRLQLMKEISEAELMIKLLEQRIAQLEDNERKKAAARQQAQTAMKLAQQGGQ